MSSVTEIETAIRKLSVADQRTIARHLGQHLVEKEAPTESSGTEEGIPFLAPFAYDSRPEPREALGSVRGRRVAALR